jgi:hypothetical protein
LPITTPINVVASHLWHPLRLANRVAYALATDDGTYYSPTPPDIYDSHGAPTPLNAELARGSVVRVSVAPDGALIAVMLISPIYKNPFGGDA